ncbi:MAG: DNA polymerase III subunit delta' [Synechococcus sp.]|nr:DNA polymerase III subunit delta' [Synechococcus sp.]
MAELFADLLGQPRAAALLEAALRQDRLAPAYLFAGPDGVGRRLAALRFLEGVLAGRAGSPAVRRRLEQGNHPDLLWVEPTYLHQGQLHTAAQAREQGLSRRALPQLRLEQVREVTRFLSRRPVEASRTLVVLEGADAMAEAAANALLKTLEEPGEGLLLLISAAPEQLLGTIRSRCQQIPFARLSPVLLEQVLAALPPEPPDPACPADPPELLALAAGSPGALLQHRQQWRALPPGLAERLLGLGSDPLEALALARDLSEALEAEQQLWLLDWWQWTLWQRQHDPAPLRRLELLRRHLQAYVQPRLAWEVALLDLAAGPALRPTPAPAGAGPAPR